MAAEEEGYLASEMFKCSSHRSPTEDLFGFFNLYITMVLKGSGLQPCLYINILGGGVCVCVCTSCGGLKVLIPRFYPRSVKSKSLAVVLGICVLISGEGKQRPPNCQMIRIWRTIAEYGRKLNKLPAI